MLSETHSTFTDQVKETIHDPITLLPILQQFRIQITMLAVANAVIDTERARSLLALVRSAQENLEVPMMAEMRDLKLLTPYFTGQPSKTQIQLYLERIVLLLRVGLDNMHRDPVFDSSKLYEVLEEAVKISVCDEVRYAKTTKVLKGCVNANHCHLTNGPSLVVVTCSPKLCDGQFTLGQFSIKPHWLTGSFVKFRDPLTWSIRGDNRTESYLQPWLGSSTNNNNNINNNDDDDDDVDDDDESLNGVAHSDIDYVV